MKDFSRSTQVLARRAFFTGETGFAHTVFHQLQTDLYGVPDLHLYFAFRIAELLGRNRPFRLEAHVNDDKVVIDAGHDAGEQLAGLEALGALAFFKHLGKTGFNKHFSVRGGHKFQ
ncbi:hypothetical protein GGI1_00880 [Acidithiobacillus sp. GGI-221]|nr:hypothetical protein GGI1_00880 [Acidithiobacillus sp. GGI-221]